MHNMQRHQECSSGTAKMHATSFVGHLKDPAARMM